MFRLVKLMAYGLLGYAMYEFFRGMTEECEARSQGQMRSGNSAEPQQQRGGNNLTGAGRGVAVATQDPTGASGTHLVGRGVTH